MANKKIIDLPAVASVEDTDLLYIGDPVTGNLAKATKTVILQELAALVVAKANSANPTFTGTVTIPTASSGNNSTQAASTAFVQAALSDLIASSPAALNTLNELAAALGNDPNFATTVTNALAGKMPYGGGTFIGDISVPDEAYGGGWNGSLEVPTKNAIYDKLESFVLSGTANYATLTEMKAVRPANGTVVTTGGYSTMYDGGHGFYIYDSTSSQTADGGIIITPTTGSGNGRWKQLSLFGEINAKTFGVKLDYTTDDTAALQAAINACQLYEYDLYIPRGIARTTAELTIGTASSDSQYNQSSFKIRGAGISSDPNASVFPGAEGTQIRIEGTGHRSVIAFQESVWRYGQIEDLTVTCHTLGGATYGILWTDSRHSQFKLRRVHAERINRCFGELKGNGLNGEFIRFEDCGGTGEQNFFFMDAGSGQAFGHYFEHCTGGVKDGGALFEIGGGGLGFGITLEDFHSSSIGSSAEVDPAFNALAGVSFLRNHGISGYFHVSGGRNEHVNTIIENISTSYNEAGRISFDSVEFDGMTCTNSRPTIKNTGGFAGAYGVKFTECSFNRFGFGNEDLGVFSTSFHSIDACDFLFERCIFNFQYFNIRNSYFTRVDFKNCVKSTPGRPQPFSNHGEFQRNLSDRSVATSVFHPQGRPENFLKQSGFTVGNNTAPSPWVHAGSGTFGATVKAFPDAGVASWSSSPNARLITLNSASSVYQDITEIDFSSGVHQAISGHTTGYFHAIIDTDNTYTGNVFEFSLENSVSGRIYDKQSIIVSDHTPKLCSINLSAVDADGSGLLRVRIALTSGGTSTLRIHQMTVTNDPSAVYANTAGTSVSFTHAWDLNTDLARINGRLQLPAKTNTFGSDNTLPNVRVGEVYWSTTDGVLKLYNGSTWSNVAIQKSIQTTASSATPTPTSDTTSQFNITALAENATFAAPTGTPVDGQTLLIRIKDNGSARTLAWNAIYRGSTDFALPTTTVISKTMYVQFVYNAADTKWDATGFTNGL